jgi:hypothetical protein
MKLIAASTADRLRKYMTGVTAALAVSGCAGRAPAPVPVVQAQDR